MPNHVKNAHRVSVLVIVAPVAVLMPAKIVLVSYITVVETRFVVVVYAHRVRYEEQS